MESVINKLSILEKTHYGTTIYSHILREYYPDEVVMTITGRDCGLCRNPFNFNKETLHIWIEKSCKREQNSNKFEVMPNTADFARSEKNNDFEIAKHEDIENVLPSGDAFDFAEYHYKQKGEELLQTINKELYLHIGEKRDFYRNAQKFPSPCREGQVMRYLLSFFRAPISNTTPLKAISLLDIYKYIIGDYARQRTEKLRSFDDVKRARIFKATNFDYCTFSGTFNSRNDKDLIKHSNLLCLDFDHIKDLETLFKRLLNDEYFETQLLFRSPSGDGLKWIIQISPPVGDLGDFSHSNYFAAVANYIQQTYGIEVDKSGRDISRACFLPYDPQAYLNPVNK
jgi:hypothetical protein